MKCLKYLNSHFSEIHTAIEPENTGEPGYNPIIDTMMELQSPLGRGLWGKSDQMNK